MSVDRSARAARSLLHRAILQPADAGYDDARRVHNGLIDKRPALIARCRGIADVADAVKLARTLNLEVAVRGGGHNVAGRGDDRRRPDDRSGADERHPRRPGARTARAQGGVLWKEFNRETQVHGLATTGGVVGTTGIAGLTLGGGLGWLMPKYGLALDNLRSGRDGDGRRTVLPRQRGRERGSVLGDSRRRRQLRHRRVARVRPASGRDRSSPAGWSRIRSRRDASRTAAFFRDTCATLPDEMMLVAGLHHRAGRIRREAGRHCRPRMRAAGGRRGGGQADQGVRTAGMDAMGPIPYCDAEQPARCRVPEGRAELLEGAVPHRPERRLRLPRSWSSSRRARRRCARSSSSISTARRAGCRSPPPRARCA